jgi:hypothetical protein
MIIGLAGGIGAGKTTVSQYLVETHGFARVSFATPIRNMLRALGVPDGLLMESKNHPVPWFGGKSARELMQTLGTEWGRATVSKHIWLYQMQGQLDGYSKLGMHVVIDDVRFDNEAEFIRMKKDGFIIKLERGNTPKEDDPYTLATDEHVSEQGVSDDLVDGYLKDGGSVAATCANLEQIMNDVLPRQPRDTHYK